MEYKVNKVLIFPDYTSEVMSQRCSFRNVMQTLRKDGIKFQLRYLAKLRVYWKGEDVPEVFNHPAQAEAAHQQKKHSATKGEVMFSMAVIALPFFSLFNKVSELSVCVVRHAVDYQTALCCTYYLTFLMFCFLHLYANYQCIVALIASSKKTHSLL